MITRRFTGKPPQTVLPAAAIDCHMHAFAPDFPAQAGGPDLPEAAPGLEDYSQVMKWLGVSRFVLTQGNAHQKNHGNLLALLKQAGPAARGVAAIGGDVGDAEIEQLSAAGVVGTRIVDLPGGAVGLDELAAVDERAHAADWMVAVQFDGSDLGDHFDRLMALRSNWTFDHHGKFLRGVGADRGEVDMIKRLIDRGNCWFKFCGCYESSRTGGPEFADVAAISREVASYAPERIIWASNFPHNMAQRTEDYPDDGALLDTVLGWLPDGEALHKALVENPEHLFKFNAT